MLLIGFPSRVLAANCYVLATGPGEECLVVDPGVGVADRVREVIAEHRLRPTGIVLTHGHADHVWDAPTLCGADVPVLVHEQDAYRLVDPMGDVGPALRPVLEEELASMAASGWTPPDHVRPYTGGDRLTAGGVTLEVLHAPGHTEGSALLRIDDAPDQVRDAGLTRTVLTGDVLFNGSIGRTDLPGGDGAAMQRSLRDVVVPLGQEPDALVLPGHGPASTVHREVAQNPYLR